MKKVFFYSSVLATASLLCASCSEDENDLGKTTESSFSKMSIVVDAMEDNGGLIDEGLRAFWAYESNQENYNSVGPEQFTWEGRDSLVVLSLDSATLTPNVKHTVVFTKDGLPSTSAEYESKLPFWGASWFFYPDGNVGFANDMNYAYISMNIQEKQDEDSQKRCVFLKSDRVDTKEGKVNGSDKIRLKFMTSNLRFRVYNMTNDDLVVKRIRVVSDKDKPIFVQNCNYSILKDTIIVQENQNDSHYRNNLTWENKNWNVPAVKYNIEYRDSIGKATLNVDEDTTFKVVDKIDTIEYFNKMYDAVLVTFPVDGKDLVQTSLKVIVTMVDMKDPETELTYTRVYSNTVDRIRALLEKGFLAGKRTLFGIKIESGFKVNINGEIEYPGGWTIEDEISKN